MVYHGHIQNGVIVFDNQPPWPEGTRVRIEAIQPAPSDRPAGNARPPQTWAEVFGDLVGRAQGLPADMARNHDHYLHGAPRK